METERERSVDRLVAFTDAVVAIAITLLVLPLAEVFSAPSADRSPTGLLHHLGEHIGPIWAFLLSFVLIARLWWAHHRVFAAVRSWTPALVVLDLLWTLTIVVIPVTTAILPNYDTWPLSFGIYAGTLLLSSAALTGMAALSHLSDAISTTHGDETRNRLIGNAVSTAVFAVALALGLAVKQVNFFALLLLLLSDPVESLLRRRYARREVVRRPR